MHDSSIMHMKRVFEKYIGGKRPGTVLEIGSASRNAPFRTIFEESGWRYTGADLESANNVDLVLSDPFSWSFGSGSYDVVISGQMLEHNTMFWLTFIEMARVLADDGLMVHVAPSRGPEHRAPQDCWRFYRDGMVALAEWAGLECLEASTDWRPQDIEWVKNNRPGQFRLAPPESHFPSTLWGDTVGVFRKRPNARPDAALRYMRTLADKWDDRSEAQRP